MRSWEPRNQNGYVEWIMKAQARNTELLCEWLVHHQLGLWLRLLLNMQYVPQQKEMGQSYATQASQASTHMHMQEYSWMHHVQSQDSSTETTQLYLFIQDICKEDIAACNKINEHNLTSTIIQSCDQSPQPVRCPTNRSPKLIFWKLQYTSH